MAAALARTNWRRELKTLLILGRVSNLPTVWSNCLAGWLLGGGGSAGRFALLCAGASSLYVSGMFLNDAFDAEFDRQFRKERPIPSALIAPSKVWGWGFGWLAAGLLLLSLLGRDTLACALILSGAIVLYDGIHKAITLSPIVMGLCRFQLYLVASSAAVHGITGLSLWSGAVLASYVVGISYIARKESSGVAVRFWPISLLVTPIVLAWIVNEGPYKLRALCLAILLACWILRCLRDTYWSPTRSIGRTVAGLLAGICLIDLLAVAGGTPATASLFLTFFIAALLCQRFIPAT